MGAPLEPGEARPVDLTGLRCLCARCSHEWTTTAPTPPEACPSCKSRSWRTQAGTVKRGRPFKAKPTP